MYLTTLLITAVICAPLKTAFVVVMFIGWFDPKFQLTIKVTPKASKKAEYQTLLIYEKIGHIRIY